MSKHQTDFVEEVAQISDSVLDTYRKARIQRWVLPIATLPLFISLGLYFWKFHGGLSYDQDTWGQFGDFLGGVVNPIVGLCTILLLTVSINQSHQALGQTAQALNQSEESLKLSVNEIKIAQQALLDNQQLLAATKEAMTNQTLLSEESRDMNNTLALYTALSTKADELTEELAKSIAFTGSTDIRATKTATLNKIRRTLAELETLLDEETARLIEKRSKKP